MGGHLQKAIEVRVGELRCAVPLERAVEVLQRVEITPLSGLPAHLPGYVRYRGRAVPVLDLRARMEQPPAVAPFDEHLLVVRTRGPTGARALLALLVDRVAGLVDVDPAGAEPADAPPVSGVVALPDGLLLLTDPDRALTIEEDRAARAALDEEGP